jgi:nucleoid-associated protein YgaU
VRPQPVELAPVTPPPAPAAAGPRHHTVGKSDSLTKLSLKYYGNANRWQDILKANPKVIKNPNVLPLGADIVIP